ncbi:MAG: bifunctional lysylphosphatidylglycerol flippase/synthetase MprF [Pseudomonadota bacterium]|nr:bifunctional lysylphosphatidylglycerol flippase/synthetase MprF [Pseudomonadota bacterium]
MSETAPDPRLNRLIALTGHPLFRAALPLAIVVIATIVLHRLSGDVHLRDIRADLAATSPHAIAFAILATVASFAAISLYDVIAARAVAPGAIPTRIAAITCATGYALSNLLGFSYVTGAAVRYRVFAGYGLDFPRVALLIAYSWSGFFCGLVLVLGGLFIAHPSGISAILPISGGVETATGILLLGALAGFFLLLRVSPQRITIFGSQLNLPAPSHAAALTATSVVDLIATSLCLYVLMPADLVGNYPFFFLIFVAAVALGILSHAPGGLGVFDATVLAGLGATGRSDALAALLLYRVIYTGLPFLVASFSLVITELHNRRAAIGTAARTAETIVRPFVPLLSSGVALAAGTILLVSGNLPALGDRIATLKHTLPLGIVEASHLAGSVAGVLLLVVARGLYRRLWRAWRVALVLLGIGIVASLAKGLDIEEASALLLAAGTLWVFRGAFYRVEGAMPLRVGLGWFLSVTILFAALFWIGLLAFRHVEYRDALWWQISWSDDASRFLRASLAGAVALGALALNSLLGARVARHKAEPIPDIVRQLVAESPESDANIALLGDKSFLLDPDDRAALAYADTGSALVTKGDPFGDTAAGARLLWRFREMADREGKRAVFYAVSPKFLSTFLDMGLAVVKFGEVARVDLGAFTLDTPAMKDFRHAKNRATREGYRFEIVPAADFASIASDLRMVSDAWLAQKQGKEKGFSLGYFDETYLANFDTAVLRAPETGRIVAFANVLAGARVELSVDLMRYDPKGPNFAMDALFAELMLWGKAQGFKWFNLGAAPVSGAETHALASPWQRLGGFVYEHGKDIYHFEGLRSYKEKFRPVWTPNYIACARGLGVARAFMDANLLISGGMKGLMRKGAS